jgi:peptidoglycan/xylan/chitin deacetylase (PgdA/CDA1 family)
MLIIGVLTLTSCQIQQAVVEPTPSTKTQAVATLQPTQTIATKTPTATTTPTATVTSSTTPPPPTHTPSLTPTPTWVYHEPGQVVAPILLYHHVNGENTDSRYRVSIPDFQAQMNWLNEQGYTAITISMLVEALIEGGELPEKPIVITFDDGHMSVYEHAFPIMEELGFPGVFYIVANRINNAPDFVNIEQISTLVNAGWEIGSHGYTHLDVTKNHSSANYEIGQSKADLQTALGAPIRTFAYPYGEIDPFTAQIVSNSGYRAGMGLGKSITHTWGNLFYLHRIEIHGTDTLEMFAARLTPD